MLSAGSDKTIVIEEAIASGDQWWLTPVSVYGTVSDPNHTIIHKNFPFKRLKSTRTPLQMNSNTHQGQKNVFPFREDFAPFQGYLLHL